MLPRIIVGPIWYLLVLAIIDKHAELGLLWLHVCYLTTGV